MPWQPADPGTIAKDAQGAFHIYSNGAWLSAPPGSIAKDAQGTYHVNSDAIGSAPKPDPIQQANNTASAEEDTSGGPVQHVIDMLKAVPAGVTQMLEGMGKNAVEHPLLGNIPALVDTIKRVAASPSATLTSVSNAVQNATPEQVGRNVVGPLVAGGAAGEGVGAVRGALGGALDDAGQLGLRTAEGPGATMAGNTAGTTLDIQNQRVAENVLGADAGVPHTSPVNPSTLKTARVAPGQVLNQGYNLVPKGPLSEAAANQVAAARGPATITKPTPNVSNAINDIESSLLDPNGQFTGPELRATRNSLNSDADAAADSTDADQRAIAQYKRRVVSALDQHLQDSLPQGSAITPDQVSAARSTLAKNYQLQDLIGKGGDIDLQRLAKLHRDSPDLLTGPTRTVAQFASDHPEVTGGISDATRISPPSMMGDIANLNVLQRPIGSVGQALFGGLGRRLLRGAPGEAIGRAMQTPVAGLGGEFDLQPLTELHPPPGQAFAPHQPDLATGAPTQPDFFGTGTSGMTASSPTTPPPAARVPPGDIPLADVLSHGVEQSPPAGLSVGPMGSPEPQGIPFQRNAAHEAGGLGLSPESRAWLDAFENNRDLPAVASQRVPDGTVTRAPQNPGLKMPVAHSPAFLTNNASGATPISEEFANAQAADQAAGVTRKIIDPDGRGTPISGAAARDVGIQGSTAGGQVGNGIAIEERPGQPPQIINPGKLSPRLAQGLLSRYIAMRDLGHTF
jgi:hypothetical protein